MNKLLATVLTVAVLASASSAVMAQEAWDKGMQAPYAHPGLAREAARARHNQDSLPTVQAAPIQSFDNGGYSPRVDIQ